MPDPLELREQIRARYATAAAQLTAGDHERARTDESNWCTPGALRLTDEQGGVVFGADLYDAQVADGAAAGAVAASLGCGVPTVVADLHPGEVVLDLGSGAGADVLISARRVGPHGRAIGLDMTPEMLNLARVNAEAAGVSNAEFLQGYLEEIPLPDACVDVAISNCVINLAADKNVVLAEAARVLRPGGRFAVSDVIADADSNEGSQIEMETMTGCVAGALTAHEYRAALDGSGLVDVEIVETHRVHARASAAIVRARKAIAFE